MSRTRTKRYPHRVIFETYTSSGQNAAGDDTGTWANLYPGEYPAHVLGKRGAEQVVGDQVEANNRILVEIPYNADLPKPTAQMRVSWGTRTLNIVNVDDDVGRDFKLTLVCIEVP